MLWAECQKSIRYRYPADPESDVIYGDHESRRIDERPSPIALLKACDCYAYQSCEHNGWEKSEACRFIAEARIEIIRKLPGWDDAPWGIG